MIQRKIRKRDGKTVFLVRLRDAAGKPYTRQFETEPAAERWETAEKHARNTGRLVGAEVGTKSLVSVAEEWLESNPMKAEGSLAKDRGILANQVLPQFGTRRVGSITKVEIQKLVNAWVHHPYPNETVRRNYSCLRAVFTYAEDCQYISRDQNPCHKISLPPRERRVPPKILDGADLERLADAMGPCGSMVYVAIMGPRWGEIAGLRVGDIEFGSINFSDHYPSIAFDRQLTRGEKGRMVLKDTTKSHRAKRVLAIPQWLADMLFLHVSVRGVDPAAFVFTSPRGEMLHYSNWRRRYWLPAREAIEMPELEFHDLKHAASTALDNVGVGDAVKEHRLGSSAQVIRSNYQQLVDPADRAAAEAIGEIFRPPSLS